MNSEQNFSGREDPVFKAQELINEGNLPSAILLLDDARTRVADNAAIRAKLDSTLQALHETFRGIKLHQGVELPQGTKLLPPLGTDVCWVDQDPGALDTAIRCAGASSELLHEYAVKVLVALTSFHDAVVLICDGSSNSGLGAIAWLARCPNCASQIAPAVANLLTSICRSEFLLNRVSSTVWGSGHLMAALRALAKAPAVNYGACVVAINSALHLGQENKLFFEKDAQDEEMTAEAGQRRFNILFKCICDASQCQEPAARRDAVLALCFILRATNAGRSLVSKGTVPDFIFHVLGLTIKAAQHVSGEEMAAKVDAANRDGPSPLVANELNHPIYAHSALTLRDILANSPEQTRGVARQLIQQNASQPLARIITEAAPTTQS